MKGLESVAAAFGGQLNLFSLAVQLGIGLILAYLLALTVSRCSKMVGDKEGYFILFPLLIPTIILVISVVKSSLALSLGLVGALSIVRFRTPVKEPEELAYIFIAISVGLGIGAGQVYASIVAFIFVLIVIGIHSVFRGSKSLKGVFLDVLIPKKSGTSLLKDYSSILDNEKIPYDLRRYEELKETATATFYIEPKHVTRLEGVLAKLRDSNRDAEFTLVKHSQSLS